MLCPECTVCSPQLRLRRCLEWDSGAQSRFYFSKHCDVVDVITYFGDGHAQLRVNTDSEKRDYFLDIHIADQVVPENSTGLVICSQVFEHLLKPWLAMRQLYRLLGPGRMCDGLTMLTVHQKLRLHARFAEVGCLHGPLHSSARFTDLLRTSGASRPREPRPWRRHPEAPNSRLIRTFPLFPLDCIGIAAGSVKLLLLPLLPFFFFLL